MPDYVEVEEDYRDYLGCWIEDDHEGEVYSDEVNQSNYLDKMDWEADDYEEAYYNM